MQDIPGLDPDGLLPGGFTLAGKARVGSLDVAGLPVVSSVVSVGAWSCNTGLAILSTQFADLPLDTVARASADIGYTAGQANLTFLNTGIYLLILDTYSNITWAAGALGVRPDFSDPHNIPRSGVYMGHEGSGFGAPVSTLVVPATAGDTVAIQADNQTGADDTIFGDIVICRLV